ncbi:Zn(2)-C6 fungal-type domain-containing protein [Mycena sanguinolenta]|uniref:Zn(2)-C6 fungal-type domain-containing protein n=1 Tax=Mycena sanguinolenta TaxID=230812 RepID=A0A8H6U555_9AGAR|nr:Zn(2)-C6 fungal-type domain-containing protein [Mycena sanguinolenta]
MQRSWSSIVRCASSRCPHSTEGAPDDVGANLQRCVLEHAKETILMYIHRSFFCAGDHRSSQRIRFQEHVCAVVPQAYRASATILKSCARAALLPCPARVHALGDFGRLRSGGGGVQDGDDAWPKESTPDGG